MATTIEEFVDERGIRSLFHFTRLANLDSILQSGLLPRDVCARSGKHCVVNDHYRHDGTSAICASISFPNYKMFYPLRIDADNADAEWVVLKLKRSLLWRTRCGFCVTNAADATVSAISLANRQGLPALRRLFDDYGTKARSSLGIPDHYTTNPQAEVLLLDGSTPEDIKTVYFQRSATMTMFREKYKDLPCHLDGGYFSGRSDYKHWK